MKRTGYREMLRDRCPKVVSLALRWCNAKEKWLDHVYKSFIWIYSDNNERLKATKTVLGLDSKRGFVFEDTIDKDNLSKEDESFWKNVTLWVSWFQKRYAYVENTYRISKQKDKDLSDIKLEIMTKYLKSMCPTKNDSKEVQETKNQQINRFVDFLIDCFENKI